MTVTNFDIAILGGGAAGLSSAISAAKASRENNKKISIAIFESKNKIGQSILKTGNGRCNFSNERLYNDGYLEYTNNKFVNKVFSSADKKCKENNIFKIETNEQDIPAAFKMFEEIGLSCQIDNDGKMFPFSGKASSVLDVLRFEIQELGIKIFTGHEVAKISDKNNNIDIKFKNGKLVKANKIIIASGSCLSFLSNIQKYQFTKVLGPVKTETKYISNLDGIRTYAKVSICDKHSAVCMEEYGEVLFRKYGLSGICIFNLSRFVNKKVNQQINIDFSPEVNTGELTKILQKRYKRIQNNGQNKITAERLLAGMCLPQIAKSLCKFANIENQNIARNDLSSLAKAIKTFNVKVKSIGDESQCQVSRGGIAVQDINAATMQIKKSPNIFVAGEAIDVDGPCGGYNLH